MAQLCRLLQEGGTVLLQRHRAQLHTLLGLYAMTMNQMEWAETQFNAALRVTNNDLKYLLHPDITSLPISDFSRT